MTTSTRTLFLLAGMLTEAACIRTAGTPGVGPSDAASDCIHTCTPDPGSGPVNCAAEEAGLEFFPIPIVNFETQSNGMYFGRFMYTYFDGTSSATPFGYDSRLVAVAAGRCSIDDPMDLRKNHVLHFIGGPFIGWGGGMGVAMEHLSQEDAAPCTQANPPDYCPPPSAGDAVSHEALDLSQWDGVAVWARRGPDSQSLLRVLVGNKDTDDDISYWTYDLDKTLPRNCERVRECACTYQNLPCTPINDPVVGRQYFCGPPGVVPGMSGMAQESSSGMPTNTCDVTRCNDPYSAYPNGRPGGASPVPDPQFGGKPCTPYTFRSGTQSSYCFDPAVDPPPAQPDQQCGDHWTAPLTLDTDWHLFKVPFNTMFQQGFAKKFPSFDLKSISVVRLTWEAGYVDYWIDDLRFYRNRR